MEGTFVGEVDRLIVPLTFKESHWACTLHNRRSQSIFAGQYICWRGRLDETGCSGRTGARTGLVEGTIYTDGKVDTGKVELVEAGAEATIIAEEVTLRFKAEIVRLAVAKRLQAQVARLAI